MANRFLELEDRNGTVELFRPVHLLEGRCRKCNNVVYATSNLGNMNCLHCGDVTDWSWGKATLHFVPESGAPHFSSHPPPPIHAATVDEDEGGNDDED